jgi:hypothetical protein
MEKFLSLDSLENLSPYPFSQWMISFPPLKKGDEGGFGGVFQWAKMLQKMYSSNQNREGALVANLRRNWARYSLRGLLIILVGFGGGECGGGSLGDVEQRPIPLPGLIQPLQIAVPIL